MKAQSYIGITGFMSRSEVDVVLAAKPAASERLLMVGVLVSAKTMRMERNSKLNRYPFPCSIISGIIWRHPRVLNLVHYATDDRRNLSLQLDMVSGWSGSSLDGFQLNMVWPDPREMERYKIEPNGPQETTFVLQVGGRAFEKVRKSPKALARKLADEYDGLADYVLIDPSGGEGKPFDPVVARACIEAVTAKCPNLAVGLAGGLGPDTLDCVEPLLRDFPDLCLDAEGRLRTPVDNLDLDRAVAYLQRAEALCVAAKK